MEVYYHGSDDKQLMGRLSLENRQIFFEYDSQFIKMGLELSPIYLPLQEGVIKSNYRVFNGLFGVFNDSLPDGWGRLLLDRKCMRAGLNPTTLSPLDRLSFVGNYGMGALSYAPEHPHTILDSIYDLEKINQEIQATLNEDYIYVEDLFTLSGSSAGARPKILVSIHNEDWLIKFRSRFDVQDISAIEYAYHLMAKDAGLLLPNAKLFASRQGYGFFGVKRFDRNGKQRIHMHSISGLLHVDHREPLLDYENIMQTTWFLTKDIQQCEAQFRNSVFNILSHNRDDHSKNFSFLMDNKGCWTVSPAYDLTFSTGPAGEHASMIMGEGKNPTRDHVLKLADTVDIQASTAREIIDSVLNATEKWCRFADEAGVSTLQSQTIEKTLSAVRKKFDPHSA
jgi:serine/threonine-protein kinase HipA